MKKRNFKIVFKKLNESKKSQKTIKNVDYELLREIDNDIQTLKESIVEEDNVFTYTRT